MKRFGETEDEGSESCEDNHDSASCVQGVSLAHAVGFERDVRDGELAGEIAYDDPRDKL